MQQIRNSPPANALFWERFPNESNLWFRRFQLYLFLGWRRTVHAAYIEDFELSKTEENKTPLTGTPGAWRRNALQFSWIERAEAWDTDRAEKVESVLKETWENLAYSGPDAVRVLIGLLASVDEEQRRLSSTAILQRLFTLYGTGSGGEKSPPITLVEYV